MSEQEIKLAKVYEDAKSIMSSGYSCAESVLGAIYKNLNMELPEQVVGLASGFGGGIGGSGNTCGALTGAVMAIGMVLGSKNLEQSNNSRARALANELLQWFTDANEKRTLSCSVLLEGYTKGMPDQFEYCKELTAQSACKAMEIILKELD